MEKFQEASQALARMLFPWYPLVGGDTKIGGYNSHVVMETVVNGSILVKLSLGVSPMEMFTGEPFELV